ncbi:MAG: hypothetical protein HFI44_06605 [Lachnospiraceae bacterium]|nr:hypothetical protein [Lachnospiraceae bacterium]GFI03187.1 hypothetical protein IMSAGC005_02019 [Lachnospiraceae bacterium]
METKKRSGSSIGASSLLVIVVVVSLVCFAALSITSASADLRLSQKLAERTSTYYTACNEAQNTLKSLSTSFSSIYKDSISEDDYNQKIKKSFSDSLTFSYPINENQILQVSVSPLYPEDPSGDFLQITSWQIINIASPELDESLPVFQIE